MKNLNEGSLNKVSGGYTQPGKKSNKIIVRCYDCSKDYEVANTGVSYIFCSKCNKKLFIPVNNIARS